jgi:cellulose biosynthesis protein BcsQ
VRTLERVKTFTSINLGISIAQEIDRTVLIVDADLKNPAKDHYDFATDFLVLKRKPVWLMYCWEISN